MWRFRKRIKQKAIDDNEFGAAHSSNDTECCIVGEYKRPHEKISRRKRKSSLLINSKREFDRHKKESELLLFSAARVQATMAMGWTNESHRSNGKWYEIAYGFVQYKWAVNNVMMLLYSIFIHDLLTACLSFRFVIFFVIYRKSMLPVCVGLQGVPAFLLAIQCGIVNPTSHSF